MSFYIDWYNCFITGKNCNSFIKQFLQKSPQSIAPLISGESGELQAAYDILNLSPLRSFFDVILSLRINREITASDIPQYSSFDDGANRIPELLEFYPQGENFVNLGYQMISAANEAANRKYGENHARLAESLSLVTISDVKPRIAKVTAWGRFLVQYSPEEKHELLKRIILREIFLQVILQAAFQGPTSYFKLVPFLAETTAVRRRSNTKHLIEFLLMHSDWECYLENIDWK